MITYKLHTHIGNRSENQDSVGVIQKGDKYCFALADGLGGHKGGKIASQIAVGTVLEEFSSGLEEKLLDKAFVKAQEKVLEEQKSLGDKGDMKTTLNALFIDGNKARWGHIGDSRIYYFSRRRLKARTYDHSVPQMLVNMGEIKDKDIRRHVDRNRLLRVIGAPWNKRSYELSSEVTTKGFGAFLMCSDGFWEFIDERTMVRALRKAKNVDQWMELMVKAVMRNGKDESMDNNSAIAIWMEG